METPDDGTQFDIIIVGAGTAGCVLASRLSERLNQKILLIEAGRDFGAGAEPPDMRDPFPLAHANPNFRWPDIKIDLGLDVPGKARRTTSVIAQGRGVGGSSNIQGMFAVRGLPEDYDDWCLNGARGWAWADVLPYFIKLERDLNFQGPLHGDRGPIPIRRTQTWAPFAAAMGSAIERRGYVRHQDYNGDFEEGLYPLPMASTSEQRVSAATGYLTPAVRRRPNLIILQQCKAERLLIQHRRVHAVLARVQGIARTFRAHETIVACGALMSPALLLRSGVGPGSHLQQRGVEVQHHLAGVGANLQNHPKVQDVAVHLPFHLRQPSQQPDLAQNCLRYSSGAPGCDTKDMFMCALNRTAWHALGAQIGALAVVVQRPYSTGVVELAEADPAGNPYISFRLLSDARDEERLVGGLKMLMVLLDDPSVRVRRHEAFLPPRKIVARLAQRTTWNRLQARALALLLDVPIVRRTMLKEHILDVAALACDTTRLRAIVREQVELSRHACGTCRMGAESNPLAVVDNAGRVHGMQGLRVVDASIFPQIPRANTHIPVLMVAEKIADHLLTMPFTGA